MDLPRRTGARRTGFVPYALVPRSNGSRNASSRVSNSFALSVPKRWRRQTNSVRRSSTQPNVGQGVAATWTCVHDTVADERRSALLVVDHGSKRTAANDMLLEIGEMIRGKTAIPVYTAHMEIAAPTIDEGVKACIRDGATHLIVVPFFLSPGRHSTTDIPSMTKVALGEFPDVTYEVRPPIGTHPGIIDVIIDRAGLQESVQN